jgi:Outer membrane protein beta-barrel domain
VKAFLWFALVAMSMLSRQAFSQILVGPVAGANYSWTTFGDKDLKDSFKSTPTFGFHAGGHLAFKVRNRFFLHTSLLYATKGREIEGKIDTKLRLTERYSYIDMPISYTVDFRGNVGRDKEFKYFLGIGPNISYWLNVKGTLYNSDLEENNIGEISYKAVYKKDPESQQQDEMNVEQPNRFQFGLNFVAGMVLEPAPKQRLLVSVRYELGHSYLAKADGIFLNTYFQDPLRSRNQGFRVSVAYLVDLKTEERKKGKSTSTIDKKKRR